MWKMYFNPHLNKQAQMITFSRQFSRPNYFRINFNNASVYYTPFQKHLNVFIVITTYTP